MKSLKYILCGLVLFTVAACNTDKLVPVGEGWANNSVNVTVFRKNSLVTDKDVQFTAYYDAEGYVVLGKRKLKEDKWELKKTFYKGNVSDAHNIISIMIDGDGFLHISWDQHGQPLCYTKSMAPFSLDLGMIQPMTSMNENNVTYPEFFRLPDGNLIFMYRDGQSGNGNLVLNKYDTSLKRWTQLQSNLISGEDQRNAYWQSYVDDKGVIHVSWVWRETWDVSTNHDLCYARSLDGGISWENSKGEKYELPITAATAEYACIIPQNSELINQTSMTADKDGNPFIATYWREKDSEIPQYHIVYSDGEKWNDCNLNFRSTPFSLKGGGTKRIPISRPQVIVREKNKKTEVSLIFRDEERGNKVSMAVCPDISRNEWAVRDLTDFSVGSWEPSFDTELWRNKSRLNIFVQNAEQVDGEGKADIEPQEVYVLEVY